MLINNESYCNGQPLMYHSPLSYVFLLRMVVNAGFG